jgi:hypothetical protein
LHPKNRAGFLFAFYQVNKTQVLSTGGSMVLESLFDYDSELVGWIDPGKYIYDADMNLIAFIYDEDIWSFETGSWLGKVAGLNCCDREGKVVAWNPGQEVENITKPAKPHKPLLPLKPAKPDKPPKPVQPFKPLKPLDGFSDLTFVQWRTQGNAANTTAFTG